MFPTWAKVASILLVGLGLRLLAASLAPDRPLVFDEVEYASLGSTLARTGTYTGDTQPTAYRPPLYPAFLAGVERLTNRPDPGPVRMAQAVLDILSAGLLCVIALPWGAAAALWAAALWALYPAAILYTRLLYPEALFITLFLTWFLFAPRLSWERPWIAIALGIGAGVLALLKSEAVLLVLMVSVAALLRGIRPRIAALFLLGAVLAVSPWIVRNTLVMGDPALVTSDGTNLLIGNHPRATGGYAQDIPDSMRPRERGEMAVARESYRSAVKYILQDPLRFVVMGVKKTALVFASEAELAVTAFHGDPADRASTFRQKTRDLPAAIPIGLSLAYAALLLLGLLGHFAVPDDRIGWLVVATVAAWVLAHFITFGGSRYHQVLMPLAVLGAARIATDPRRIRLAGVRLVAFAVGAVLLVILWVLEARALLRP